MIAISFGTDDDEYDPSDEYGPSNPLTIKPEHIKLLRRMNVGWNPAEFGAPEIDPKRPYGNSSVLEDIREITGMESANDEWCRQLHREMEAVLQVWLRYGELSPGDEICYPAAERGNHRYQWMPIEEWEERDSN